MKWVTLLLIAPPQGQTNWLTISIVGSGAQCRFALTVVVEISISPVGRASPRSRRL